jgi:hypothetical protein
MTLENRERFIALLELKASDKLKHELNWKMEVDREEYSSYDLADAFDDVLSCSYSNEEKKIIKECENLLIEIGYLEVRELDVTISGKDNAVRRKGNSYDPVCGWNDWISG